VQAAFAAAGQTIKPAAEKKAFDPTEAARQAALRITASMAVGGHKDAGAEQNEEVEINDAPNRVLLTRKATHDDLHKQFGVAIVIKGMYKPPGKPDEYPDEKRLHMVITCSDKDKVSACAEHVRELIKNGTGASSSAPQGFFMRMEFPIDDEELKQHPHFNLVAKLIGAQGSNMKHIEHHTGAKVNVRGRGTSAGPHDERVHVAINARSKEQLDNAKVLVESLLKKTEEDFKEAAKGRSSKHHIQPQGEIHKYTPPPTSPQTLYQQQHAPGYPPYSQYAPPPYGYPSQGRPPYGYPPPPPSGYGPPGAGYPSARGAGYPPPPGAGYPPPPPGVGYPPPPGSGYPPAPGTGAQQAYNNVPPPPGPEASPTAGYSDKPLYGDGSDERPAKPEKRRFTETTYQPPSAESQQEATSAPAPGAYPPPPPPGAYPPPPPSNERPAKKTRGEE